MLGLRLMAKKGLDAYDNMRVLIYATSMKGCQEGSALEEALYHLDKGDEVYYLHCGHTMRGCFDNPTFNKAICKECQFFLHKRTLHYLPKECVHTVDEFYDEEVKREVEAFKAPDDAEAVRALVYRGVDVGYGALSTYISLTRNLNPKMEGEVKRYFESMIKQEIALTLIGEKVVELFKPDLIVFHNGRFAQYKPFLNIARNSKIDFIATETNLLRDGRASINNFFNTIPHDPNAYLERMEIAWNKCADTKNREEIGRSFFENRRYGKYSGDKIYVKNQTYGKLPEQWEDVKEHIVIFNSSEDEYAAIDKTVDALALFKNQLEGIKAIMSRYGKDDRKQFVLRIHPNLTGIPFDYHTDLYKLNYRNLIVVAPESDISSYALLDAADKVIVFGSTIGIESAYWHKPVICLAHSFYLKLDVAYNPKSQEELWKLIETNNLPDKYKEDVLKFGYFFMSNNRKGFKYVENGVNYYKLFSHDYGYPRYCKLAGSTYLYMLVNGGLRAMLRKYGKEEFKNVPI